MYRIKRLHGLIVDNFKPAAVDYAQMGSLSSTEDGSGEVSLALPSTSVHTQIPSHGKMNKQADNRMASIIFSKDPFKKPKQMNSFLSTIQKQIPSSSND